METKKLFIGGIPWSLEWQELKDIFKLHGNVIFAKVIKDRETGKSKGFGFVEFENIDEAKKAKEEMDGKELEGRKLTIDFAIEKN